jgi:hypothetical protein
MILGTVGTVLVVHSEAVGPNAIAWCIAAFAARGVFLGLGYAGGSLAWHLGHLHFAQPQRAELYMGIHVSLTGLRGLTMPGLGILLWAWIGWPVWLIAVGFSVLGVFGYVALAQDESRQSAASSAAK